MSPRLSLLGQPAGLKGPVLAASLGHRHSRAAAAQLGGGGAGDDEPVARSSKTVEVWAGQSARPNGDQNRRSNIYTNTRFCIQRPRGPRPLGLQ